MGSERPAEHTQQTLTQVIQWVKIYAVDSAMHRINLYPVDTTTIFPYTNPLDSAIQCLNRWSLVNKRRSGAKFLS